MTIAELKLSLVATYNYYCDAALVDTENGRVTLREEGMEDERE
jgi:hypothetical protein